MPRIVQAGTGKRVLMRNKQRVGISGEKCCCDQPTGCPCLLPCGLCNDAASYYKVFVSGVTVGYCHSGQRVSGPSEFQICMEQSGCSESTHTIWTGVIEESPFTSELFSDPSCTTQLASSTRLFALYTIFSTGGNGPGIYLLIFSDYGTIFESQIPYEPNESLPCCAPVTMPNQLPPPPDPGAWQGYGGTAILAPCQADCPNQCTCLPMGSFGSRIAHCSGLLRLFINDDFITDNSGSWSGTIRVNGGPLQMYTLPGNPGTVDGPTVQAGDRIAWQFTGGIDVCTPASVCPYGSAVYDPDGTLLSGAEIPVFNPMPCPGVKRYSLYGIIESGV